MEILLLALNAAILVVLLAISMQLRSIKKNVGAQSNTPNEPEPTPPLPTSQEGGDPNPPNEPNPTPPLPT